MALRKIENGAEADGRAPAEIRECPLAILKVTASWCGPCKKIHSEFVRLCGEHNTISSYVLDLDAAQSEGGDAQQLLEVLDVSALPTFIGFDRGLEVSRVKGASLAELTQLFEALAARESAAEESQAPPLEIHDAK